MEICLSLRRASVVLAVLPIVLFTILPIAPMSPAFEQPAVTVAWGQGA